VHAGGSLNRDRDLPPANVFNSGVPSPPRSPCRCAEYLSRILDLEGRLSLMKRQAKSATLQPFWLNYSSMSLSFPPGCVKLQVHMDATLQPARRIIGRLLQEDAGFFPEHHYLNPLAVDDSDQPML
jgi:hypothetical protein